MSDRKVAFSMLLLLLGDCLSPSPPSFSVWLRRAWERIARIPCARKGLSRNATCTRGQPDVRR